MPKTVVISTDPYNVLYPLRDIATGPVPIFSAPLKTGLGLEAGTGVASFTRASVATVKDFSGTVQTCKSGEARFQGARRTENKLTASSDWQDPAWVINTANTALVFGVPDKDGGTTGMEVERSGSGGTRSGVTQQATLPGEHYASVWVKVVTAVSGGSVTCYCMTNAGDSATIDVPDDGQWHRISGPKDINQFNISIQLGIENETGGGEVGDKVVFCFPQLCIYTDDYIESDQEHGANALGVKYFNTTNENTYDNGFITEVPGSPIPDSTLFGYVSESASTNEFLHSEDFTNAYWEKVRADVGTAAATAPDGSLTANTFTPTVVSGAHKIRRTDAPLYVDNGDYTLSVYVKENGYTNFKLTSATQGGLFPAATFDLAAGTLTSENNGAYGSTIEFIRDGWYRVSTSYNVGAGAAVQRAGYDAVDNLGNGSFAGDGVSGYYIWGAQLEESGFVSSYIPTVDAGVDRATDTLTYPETGNLEDAAGTLSCTISAFASVSLEARQTIGRNSVYGASVPANNTATSLNVLDSSFNQALSPVGDDALFTLQDTSFSWGTELTATWNGAAGTPGAYGGSWGVGPIGIGGRADGSTQLDGTIRNVLIYDEEGL